MNTSCAVGEGSHETVRELKMKFKVKINQTGHVDDKI